MPRMGSPFCIATLLFVSNTAPAPSLTWLEFPAVVLPSFLNTGFSFPRSDNDVLGRTPSSMEIVTGFSSPVFGSTILVFTGMISSLNFPAAIAAAAFL
uniref:Secreted protein n=1 Tax=Rhizophora mucronata TaxID=61149 RepID=A0A2P2JQA7_RHIMU